MEWAGDDGVFEKFQHDRDEWRAHVLVQRLLEPMRDNCIREKFRGDDNVIIHSRGDKYVCNTTVIYDCNNIL